MTRANAKWIRLMAVIGCTTMWMASCKHAPDAQMKASYATMKVSTANKELTTPYSATIRGRQDIDIYPQVSGTIERLCVTEGEVVRKGQLLFVIDQVPYKAALKTAQANVEVAKAALATAELNYNSTKELFAKKSSAFNLKTSENKLSDGQSTTGAGGSTRSERPQQPVLYGSQKSVRRSCRYVALPRRSIGQRQYSPTVDNCFRQFEHVCLLLHDRKSITGYEPPVQKHGRSVEKHAGSVVETE